MNPFFLQFFECQQPIIIKKSSTPILFQRDFAEFSKWLYLFTPPSKGFNAVKDESNFLSKRDKYNHIKQILQTLEWFSLLVRRSRMDEFCKKGGRKNSAKFTGKHLCWSLFVNRGCRPQAPNFIKKETSTRVFSCEF